MDNMTIDGIKFDGKQPFSTWALGVLILAKAKRCSRALTENLRSSDGKMSPEDEAIGGVALGILLATLDSSLHELLRDKTAHEAWKDLDNSYRTANTAKVINQMEAVFSTRMRDDDIDGRDYATKYQILVNAIEDQNMTLGQVAVLTFLGSLNSRFQAVKATFASMDPSNFTFKDVIAAVATQTDTLVAEQERSNNVSAAATNATSKKSAKHCTYCRKQGHTSDECWHRKREHEQQQQQQQKDQKDKKDKSDQPASKGNGFKFRLGGAALYAAHANGGLLGSGDAWLLDSGANASTCRSRAAFTTLAKHNGRLLGINGESVSIVGKGTASIGGVVGVDNVLYAPDAAMNLLSVSRLAEHGYPVLFLADRAYIYCDGAPIIGVRATNGLYQLTAASADDQDILSSAPRLDCAVAAAASRPASAATSEQGKCTPGALLPSSSHAMAARTMSAADAHLLLGHASHPYVKAFAEEAGIRLVGDPPTNCSVCVRAKPVSKPHSGKLTRNTTAPLQVVHSDVGVVPTPSSEGHRYFVSFVDEHTRLAVVHTMASKSEVPALFERYVALMENQLDTPVRELHSDNGGEYVCARLHDYCAQKGIVHSTSSLYTPQQNAVAECYNRMLCECANAMLVQSGAPTALWTYAIQHSNFLYNHMLKSALGMCSPLSLIGCAPALSHLHPFGCQAEVSLPPEMREKFGARTQSCVYLGAEEHKGVYYNLSTGRVFSSWHGAADPHSFPFLDRPRILPPLYKSARGSRFALKLTDVHPLTLAEDAPSSNSDADDSFEEAVGDGDSGGDSGSGGDSEGGSGSDGDSGSGNSDERPQRAAAEESARRTQGLYDRGVATCDYVAGASHTGPDSYRQALSSPDAMHWREAIDRELESIDSNGVMEVVPRQAGMHTITTRWVFTVKPATDERPPLHKARLVARGFQQRPGAEYGELFAPVVQYKSLRVVLALAAQYDLKLHQMDVVTAFLNGTTEEELYIEIPDGVEGDKKSQVCHLHRALYGLKQAPRAWHLRLNHHLCKMGFQALEADQAVYVRSTEDGLCILTCWVDDLLLAATSDSLVQDTKAALASEFKMKDMGVCKRILSVDVEQAPGRVRISQEPAILRMLDKLGMADANPAKTPLPAGAKLCPAGPDDQLVDTTHYQAFVGSIQYLACVSRPDIAYAASLLGTFNARPTAAHLTAAKHVVRYLKGTAKLGITYKQDKVALTGYTDASYHHTNPDSASIGYTFKIAGGAVTWRSKRIRAAVPQSTAEAELLALKAGTCEAIWLTDLLTQMSIEVAQPTLWCDNQAAVTMTRTGEITEDNKHYRTRLALPHQSFKQGDIDVRHVPSADQVADIFTKAQTHVLHYKCLASLGLSG